MPIFLHRTDTFNKANTPGTLEHKSLKNPPNKCNVFVGRVLQQSGIKLSSQLKVAGLIKSLSKSKYFQRVAFNPYDIRPGDVWLWGPNVHSGIVSGTGNQLVYAGSDSPRSFEGIAASDVNIYGSIVTPPTYVFRAK